MTGTLRLQNRCRGRGPSLVQFRRIATAALEQLTGSSSYDLTVAFLGAEAMAKVNLNFLRHAGPTDVITFDYSEGAVSPLPAAVQGEILICPDVAHRQAAEFGTPFMAEMVRYFVHGILHLQGYDDTTAPERKRMKKIENKVAADLVRSFHLG